MTYAHGLVIGKFYPPHAGHHHLIDTAAASCARVSVVVAASTAESIPLALRTAWLRETHGQPHVEIFPVMDDVEVDYTSDEIWSVHVAAFRAGVAMGSGLGVAVPPVDAVFTSEAYGPELADRLSAVHVAVDPPRDRFPVSGTAVRDDPVAAWEFLAPPVRAYLARRVVVVGAESTGTTTLARALAAHYAGRGGVWAPTRWVPEYGRTFTEEKLAAARRAAGDPSLWLDDLSWKSPDFLRIAEHHAAMEDAAARSGSPLLVCDTDAFATAIWHERYLGTPSPEVEAVHERTPHHLWILTSPGGVPFEQDGWRDGASIRTWMSERFREELEQRGLPHITVEGPHEHRLATALEATDALLTKGWTFSPPLSP
ncbi:transcriptional regulator [Actinomadura darangshiensis]|uniref:Transcriptional regulator n=1 Tax=Actinomadura darangshiensis TaxID=705336 RepID=A0A4R5AKM3_9ACTN|nr:AAA family ATPase [Actinomadura darangshiensis]TDD72180.1 transcriptional regulator [Actinomadura darangshiensis]